MNILFLGRLDDFKDPITFVRAASKLEQHKFILAGEGPLFQECKNEAKTQNISFLGWVNHSKAQELMKEADIFCQLSPIENIWAASLIEAMKNKKAIICTDAGYTNKYLKNGQHVLLIPAKSPDAIIEAIKRLQNSKLRAKLGRNAHNFIKKNMTVQKITKEILCAIQEII